jgi:ferric-dicitrate binding protein FerR (iron transport regulator)
MNDHERLLLLHKRWMDSISPEELKLLEEALSTDESFRKEAELTESLWEKAARPEPSFQPDLSLAWEKFKGKMYPPTRVSRVVSMPFLVKIAAAVAFLVVSAVAIRFALNTSDYVVVATKEFEIRKSISLPDGSIVWLNSHSFLKFPKVFEGPTRKVQLKGEAYFEVNADKKHPFIVKTPAGQVTVTGTIFHVRAYRNEGFEEVFLKKGKVHYQSRKGEKEADLVEGQKATFQKATKDLGMVADPLAIPIFWKEGRLNFQNTPLGDILTVLERHFHVEFNTSNVRKYLPCTYSVDFTDLDLNGSIFLVQRHTGISFTEKGYRSYVLKGGTGCN